MKVCAIFYDFRQNVDIFSGVSLTTRDGGHFSTSCVETKDVFNPYSEAVLFMAGYKLHICVQMFNSAC